MKRFRIRPLTAPDVPQVAALHSRVFGTGVSGDSRSYRSYFETTFLDGHAAGNAPSLLAVDEQGRAAGFLGVVFRPMSVQGAAVTAAVSSQFIVAPESRNSMVAVMLLQRFLAGEQDFSFTDEATEASAQLWERLGGVRSPLHCMHWLAPLRPANLMLWGAAKAGFGRTSKMLRPLANGADGVVRLLLPRRFRARTGDLVERPLCAGMLLEQLQNGGSWEMRPDYSAALLERLFEVASSRKRYGAFHPVALYTASGDVAGWYMYYLQPGSVCEVLQVSARRGYEAEVVERLFVDAAAGGAAALTGRMEPALQWALNDRLCLLSPRSHRMLLHSKDPNILRVVMNGAAFLSRLEGEWCLRFDKTAPR